MSEPRVSNTVRSQRERHGLSQQALAELVGVSRQAIIAIEAHRQVPSTSLSLRLAHALRCAVEDLFSLSPSEGLAVRLAPGDAEAGADVAPPARVTLGEVEGTVVAHRLSSDALVAADGLIASDASGQRALAHPLADPRLLHRNVLVSGCAPILGALAHRVGVRFVDARATWVPASSSRSLNLLQARLVHVAGLHLSDLDGGESNVSAIRHMFPGACMLVVNLTRWRQGLVVPRGNPLAVRTGAALLRPGLKFARREEGAGAHRLVSALLAREGVDKAQLRGPFAKDHAEVAQLVRCGAADVGVAIEGVALAAGLDFVPLSEERFDLVVPAASASTTPVSRLIEALDQPGFRAEMAHLPGYDADLCGHVTTLEAA